MNKLLNPKFIVLLGVVFTSFSAILTRTSTASSSVIAAYRLTFTVIVMLPLVLKTSIKELRSVSKKQLLICIVSGIFLALHFISYFTAVKYTSIVNATMLVNTQPIFIFIGSILILKEKVSIKSTLCIVVALIGSAIISMGGSTTGTNVQLGNFLAVAGAFFFAGYMMIGRVVRKNLSNTSYTFIVYSSSAILLMIINLVTKTPLYPYPKADWLIFLGLAVFCTILGHSIFNWALQYLNPAFVSISILGEPVFATVWAVFLFNEIPSVVQVIGAIIILVSIGYFTKISENNN